MIENKIVRVGVGCWVQNPKGQFLFGHRLSEHGCGMWAPPGGHLEYGESPVACASRELMEETGLCLAPCDFKIISLTNDIFPDKHYVTIHCFARAAVLSSPVVMEPNKCSVWKWLELKSLPENLFLSALNFLKQKNYVL